jgi:hypothetical protein
MRRASFAGGRRARPGWPREAIPFAPSLRRRRERARVRLRELRPGGGTPPSSPYQLIWAANGGSALPSSPRSRHTSDTCFRA